MVNKVQIRLPQFCTQEQQYICNWVLNEVFGFEIEYLPSAESDLIAISIEGSDSNIFLDASYFKLMDQEWLKEISIPKAELYDVKVNAQGKILKIVSFIQPNRDGKIKIGEHDENSIYIPFDLFGSLFFLISRYEEAIIEETDNHERFSSENSVSAKLELLDRAIGNEYIELLWDCISIIWPKAKRKERIFRLLPSHDIDFPSFYGTKSNKQILQNCLGDIVRRKRPIYALSKISNWVRFLNNKTFVDPFDQTDWLMDQSEQCGVKSAFYYIPFKTHNNDPGMPIDHPIVIDQWKRIIKRGHEIGCHPGYQTYNSEKVINKCIRVIDQQLNELQNDPIEIGGRQHVLRWKTPETANYLDAAGAIYDSTLGYAEKPGFRCGVCYEYPMYDLHARKSLMIRQRPLVAMDVSFLALRYLGLNLSDTFNHLLALKNTCKKFNGDFTLLWHNTELLSPERKDLYASILKA